MRGDTEKSSAKLFRKISKNEAACSNGLKSREIFRLVKTSLLRHCGIAHGIVLADELAIIDTKPKDCREWFCINRDMNIMI